MKRIPVVLVYVIALIILIFVIFYFLHKGKNKSATISASAQNTSASLSSQTDWDAGTKSNINTSGTPGQIKINNLSSSAITLTGMTTSASHSVSDKERVIDGNIATTWGVYGTGSLVPAGELWWKIDLGSNNTINQFRTYSCFFPLGGRIKYSADDVTYTTAVDNMSCITDNWTTNNIDGGGAIVARYVRIENRGVVGAMEAEQIAELEVYGAATATHTTGATQISGGDSYWGWQTFTPTYTKPTNTNIQFRFRSSTDGSNWTGWSDAQTPNSGSSLDISALVTNRTGDTDNPTYYKYLQIETTLSSTDGVSTPTLDDYSIGYHTNAAPSKPTGLTAVIGN